MGANCSLRRQRHDGRTFFSFLEFHDESTVQPNGCEWHQVDAGHQSIYRKAKLSTRLSGYRSPLCSISAARLECIGSRTIHNSCRCLNLHSGVYRLNDGFQCSAEQPTRRDRSRFGRGPERLGPISFKLDQMESRTFRCNLNLYVAAGIDHC